MKTTISLLFILVLSFCAFGQDILSKGKLILLKEKQESISKIKKFNKVYVFAAIGASPSEPLRESITKILKEDKSFELPAKAIDAQFFLEYTETDTDSKMRAYYLKNLQVVVVWSIGSPGKNAEAEMTKRFLEAFQKAKAKK